MHEPAILESFGEVRLVVAWMGRRDHTAAYTTRPRFCTPHISSLFHLHGSFDFSLTPSLRETRGHRSVMEQRIFDQLDRLEQGARIETRPTHETYHDSSADYSAYEGGDVYGAQHAAHYGQRLPDPEAFVEQPLTVDSLGEDCIF